MKSFFGFIMIIYLVCVSLLGIAAQLDNEKRERENMTTIELKRDGVYWVKINNKWQICQVEIIIMGEAATGYPEGKVPHYLLMGKPYSEVALIGMEFRGPIEKPRN